MSSTGQKYEEMIENYNDATAPAKSGHNAARIFSSGASRNSDEGKLDYDGFLCPLVLESYAEYMHSMRKLEDGTLRDSDNWQKGIPLDQYRKSMWRHFHAVWLSQRQRGDYAKSERLEQLNALLFNVMGIIHEELKELEL